MMTETSLPLAVADRPFGDLPSADQSILLTPPIEAAIAEVRFAAPGATVTPHHATALRNALQDATSAEFTIIEAASEGTMKIDFGPAGPAIASDEVAGWRVATSDRRFTATLFPHSATWQVNAYERWSASMGPAIQAIVNLVADEIRPDLVQRIGLRYINRIQDLECTTPRSWVGRIDASLIGAVQNRSFGSKVASAQQQVELRLDGGHAALLRHGPVPSPSAHAIDYLLDLDVFAHASNEFDAEKIREICQRLNRTAASLFQASLDEDYLAQLPRKEGSQ